MKDQSVELGEMLKVKIPFSGSGPMDFVLKKNGRAVPANDRVKLVQFDDYVVLQIKGSCQQSVTVLITDCFCSVECMPRVYNVSDNFTEIVREQMLTKMMQLHIRLKFPTRVAQLRAKFPLRLKVSFSQAETLSLLT
jgi:hypothetical protein